MKKLLFAVSALAALSLLAPSVGFAQDAANQVGIYTETTGFTSNINDIAVGGQFNAYLVLTNPINEDFNGGTGTSVPVTGIDGFEVAVMMPEGLTFLALQTLLPPDALNVGTAPDFIVGLGNSFPVVDTAAVLVTWLFASIDGGEYQLFLGATSTARFPGFMSIVDAGDDDSDPGQIVYPANNNFDDPAFAVNSANVVVPVENESWGDVKALFR